MEARVVPDLASALPGGRREPVPFKFQLKADTKSCPEVGVAEEGFEEKSGECSGLAASSSREEFRRSRKHCPPYSSPPLPPPRPLELGLKNLVLRTVGPV